MTSDKRNRDNDNTIPIGIAFNKELLKEVDAITGYISRSAWLMNACTEKLERDGCRTGVPS